jgi:aminomethyltransferase
MLRTALYDWHVAHGGRMVDFAGWEMPVQYSTITDEHHAVRKSAGLFDIAHMGRLRFDGPDAAAFLDHLLTADVHSLSVGQIRYSLVVNEQGGILDDVLVYRFADCHLLVVNASNREKIVAWIESRRAGYDFAYRDQTLDTFMFALQGPRAEAILKPLVDVDLSAIKYYWGTEGKIAGQAAIVSRTGYTGEDGFEVTVERAAGVKTWEQVVSAGQPDGLRTCGLGCRDTLRLEAAMPLYGHEMDESVDPFSAGLGFGVSLKKSDFIGKSALEVSKAKSDLPKRVGLELDGKRIAREGAELYIGDRRVGQVTSGTFSPTLEKAIAMASVAQDASAVGTALEVDIRGKLAPARVVKLPFYRRG